MRQIDTMVVAMITVVVAYTGSTRWLSTHMHAYVQRGSVGLLDTTCSPDSGYYQKL